MKRIGNLFDNAFTQEALYDAYLDARRGKRMKKDTLAFELRLGAEIAQLAIEIASGVYAPRPYKEFKVYEPKERTIKAPAFRDLVVQHAIYRIIYPIFDKLFIEQSFACRKDKGTHAASLYTQRHMRKYDGELYYLKMDIRKFFYRINRERLCIMFAKKIKDHKMIDMMMKFAGNKGEIGIPIGNLLSQLYALIYLNDLDHFIKRDIKAKSYVRYVDDMLIIGITKEHALAIVEQVRAYLATIDLEFSKWHIAKIRKGVNFVGYRTWKSKRFIRKHSMLNFRHQVKKGNMESIASLIGHANNTASMGYFRKIIKASNLINKLTRRVYVSLFSRTAGKRKRYNKDILGRGGKSV